MKVIRESIQLSKEGISISYYRYITESSIGLVLYLSGYLVLKYIDNNHDLPFFQILEKSPIENKVGIFIIVLLTSTAVGSAISGLGYFFLGFVEAWMASLFLRRGSFLLRISWVSYSANTAQSHFDCKGKDILKFAYHIQRLLEYYDHPRIRINTRRTLMRSFSFLLIFVLIVFLIECSWIISVIFISLLMMSLITASLDLCHQTLVNYYIGYQITRDSDFKSKRFDRKLKILEEGIRKESQTWIPISA